jgi:hypothetical protein
VRVIKEGKMSFELHLPLLAVCLSSDDNKEKNKTDKKLGIISYLGIIANALSKIDDCDLVISNITLPCKAADFEGASLVKPFGYQTLIYSIIAYFKTKVRSLVLLDNAVISSPNVSKTQFFITFKLSLFHLIRVGLSINRSIKKEKMRKGIKDVGE